VSEGRIWKTAGAALLCCGLADAAAAQTQAEAGQAGGGQTAAGQPGAGRTVYERAYFTQFSPSNALQIVQRVPGFSLELGDQEVRGFGQAAGNVVINGQRPSSKSDTLETILARIPANRVARVEVGAGDLFGSEFSGKPQVLNLVLTAGGGLAGTLNGTVRRTYDGRVGPEGSVSALLRRGASTFNASAGYNNFIQTEEGSDTLTALPGGNLLEFRRKTNRIADRSAYASGSWELAGGANRTAHLNFRVAKNWFDLKQTNDVFPTGGTIRDDRLSQNYDRRDIEVGGDITRPLLGGGIKLIGLATRQHRVNEDISLNRVKSAVTGGFSQSLDNERDETVVRVVWNGANVGGWSVETGAEGVLNRLDSNVNLFELDGAGGRTRIDLPVDQAVVTEYRGEAFVNAGRALSKTLRMDLGLTYEASRLTVRGDTKAERVLKFLKPKATFDWKPKGGWHAQLSLSRTVAQLQFEDFISSAELTNDRVNGGNADLLPQRAWETQLTLEHPILGDGLVKIEAGYRRISLVQDRVPTPEGFDAPGNLGNGRLFLLRSTIDAPLTRFGIKGGRLSLYGSLVSTSVEDPYTLRRRPFSGNSLWVVEANFRQDLGKFAWGFTVGVNAPSTFFRRDELDKPYSDPFVSAFAEYRPDPKTTFSFSVENAIDAAAFRERTFFFPDRRDPSADLFEKRTRNRHIVPAISLKRSFG
jgi:hypothetical protein